MSEKLGMVNYGENDEPTFLGRDMGRSRDYSEATAQEIDTEVKQFCDAAYDKGDGDPHRQARQASMRSRRRCSNTRRSTASRSTN